MNACKCCVTRPLSGPAAVLHLCNLLGWPVGRVTDVRLEGWVSGLVL